MKFNTSQMKKTASSVFAITAIMALGACSSDNDTSTDNDSGGGTEQPGADVGQTVSVTLNADQEIPAPAGVPEGASGTAEVTVSSDGTITATLGVSNLSGPATMAHIHRGFAGSTGPVVVGLTSEDGGSTWRVPADTALGADEIAAFNRGELYFNVHTATNQPGELRGQIDPGNATEFVIRLENISTTETLNVASDGSTQPVPLSPGAYIVHRNDADSPLLLPRDAANAGLEAVAEDGNTAPYPGTVPGAAIFNTPVGADAPGPIGPGGAYEFTVGAVDGDKLGFVTMFIPSNDWFYTPTDADNSLDLFVGGQPVSGEVASSDIAIWDAGTEADGEPGTGIYQVQRQSTPNSGPADADTRVSSLTGRGQSVSLNGPVLRVTITPQP
ncbi:MAG: spondin domain-containing protein [Pseudomonadota bacterium]